MKKGFFQRIINKPFNRRFSSRCLAFMLCVGLFSLGNVYAETATGGGNGGAHNSGNAGNGAQGNGSGGGSAGVSGGPPNIGPTSNGSGASGTVSDYGTAGGVGGAVGTNNISDVISGGTIVGGSGGDSGGGASTSGGGGGGGAGAFLTNTSSITITSILQGGAGGTSGQGAQATGGGGGGGAALILTGNSNVTINATMTGGNGGNAGLCPNNSCSNGQGGAGGGGAGVVLDSTSVPGSITLTNNSFITGGNGGNTTGNVGGGGGAGGGGAGIGVYGSQTQVTNSQGAKITGGGAGTVSTIAAPQGGSGIWINGNNNTVQNGGDIAGGSAILSSACCCCQIQGGNGISAANMSINITNTVTGQISGGAASGTSNSTGGAAIIAQNLSLVNGGVIAGGSGVTGGIGINATALSTINNTGSILGGNGSGSGAGGVGISGSDLSITTSGSIAGGLSGAGAQVDAINFAGGNNTLTLQNGWTLLGNIAVNNGSVTFNQSNDQVLGNIIAGNGSMIQAGPGTLVLAGNNTYSGGTTVNAGSTLWLGNGGATGSILGNVLDNGAVAFNRSDNVTFSAVISGNGAIQQIGGGSTVLTGINTYMGPTTITSGTLALSGSGSIAGSSEVIDNGTFTISETPSGATITSLSGAGSVLLGTQTLTLNNTRSGIVGDFSGVISGTGGLTLQNGLEILSGANNYSGPTTISGGVLLAEAANTFSANSDYTVQASGTLDLNSYNHTLPSLTNAGTVNITSAGLAGDPSLVHVAAPGTTLTTSNYVGQNGSIMLSAQLNSDGSPSDELVINGGGSTAGLLAANGGSATGTSSLVVINLGGKGRLTSENGIQVVKAINAGTTNSDAFTLGNPGGYVPAGPYAYKLYRGSKDGSDSQGWYLRSSIDCSETPEHPLCKVLPLQFIPDWRPEVSLYSAVPAGALGYGSWLMGSPHDDGVGSRFSGPGSIDQGCVASDELSSKNGKKLSSSCHGLAPWLHVLGGGGNRRGDRSLGVYSSDGPSYNYDFYAVQIGLDALRYKETDGGADYAGPYYAYGQMSSKVQAVFRGDAGSNRLIGNTLGAYFTHFGPQGWYVDGLLQGTWYDVLSHNPTSRISLQSNGFGIAGSLEAGYPFWFGRNAQWGIEPQAQVLSQSIDLHGTEENELPRFDSAEVQFSNLNSLAGRLGARLTYRWTMSDRATMQGSAKDFNSAWLRVSVIDEFVANPSTSFSSADGPIPFNTNLQGVGLQARAGVESELSKGFSGFLNAGATFALNQTQGNIYDARIGFKVVF